MLAENFKGNATPLPDELETDDEDETDDDETEDAEDVDEEDDRDEDDDVLELLVDWLLALLEDRFDDETDDSDDMLLDNELVALLD